MTFALAIRSSISCILPSLWDCCSFAAWYSAFSFKSPCDLASEIAETISGRFFSFKKINSSLSLDNPDIGIGFFYILFAFCNWRQGH